MQEHQARVSCMLLEKRFMLGRAWKSSRLDRVGMWVDSVRGGSMIGEAEGFRKEGSRD